MNQDAELLLASFFLRDLPRTTLPRPIESHRAGFKPFRTRPHRVNLVASETIRKRTYAQASLLATPGPHLPARPAHPNQSQNQTKPNQFGSPSGRITTRPLDLTSNIGTGRRYFCYMDGRRMDGCAVGGARLRPGSGATRASASRVGYRTVSTYMRLLRIPALTWLSVHPCARTLHYTRYCN
ncbi:hypothetical protein DENSPDRAFT_505158 [Dentipellis sp. KUC8613]|nr:hypothetical protein DENSPDRAFT_505158 [Dentipellis sp. KUC8613]